MRESGVTSGTPIVFWVHGGAQEPSETIAPSYEAERQPQALSTSDNPALAPWIPHARFAPPGPGLAALPTVRLVLPLFGATGTYLASPPDLPEALLDEPTVLQRIAEVVEEEEPVAAPAMEPAQPEFLEDEDGTTPDDWLPPEPAEPALESLAPPYWGTTTDPTRNAELTEDHGYPSEPVDLEPPLLATAEAATPDPPEERARVLSWLDSRLRHRQEQPDLLVEPQFEPFQALDAGLDDTAVALRPAEPPPQPIAPPERIETPVVAEPALESRTEPELMAPEPPVERSLLVDGTRSRRIEPRLPRRTHLPSLFAPSAVAPPARAAEARLRSRKFGWRMLRRSPSPPIDIPLPPAEAPVEAEITEARAVELPAPAPPIDIPPFPTVVDAPRHAPEDLPVQAAPEPPPAIPVDDLPSLPAEIVAPVPDEPTLTDRPAAYWAEPTWSKSAATTPDQPESLAWTPPQKPLPGRPGARRTTPAMDGLWETEPADAPNAGSDAQAGTGRRVVRRVATVCASVAVLAAASGAVLHFLPTVFVSNQIPAATFNAPMMVLRANGPGRVVGIAVQNGQTVDPDTLLLTIRTEPQPDPAAALLRARLAAAQARLADLDQSLAQATSATDAGRPRMADLRRQRAAAVIDVAQLQDAVANIPAAKPTDLPVKAGVHGVIRSLEARTGTTTAAGVPLVRMLDCDHAFLTVGPDSKLHAGEAVQVRLPNLPPVAATVRPSAGIAEPPDSLVIATPPGAFVGELSGSCPIGATATVTPSMTGS